MSQNLRECELGNASLYALTLDFTPRLHKFYGGASKDDVAAWISKLGL